MKKRKKGKKAYKLTYRLALPSPFPNLLTTKITVDIIKIIITTAKRANQVPVLVKKSLIPSEALSITFCVSLSELTTEVSPKLLRTIKTVTPITTNESKTTIKDFATSSPITPFFLLNNDLRFFIVFFHNLLSLMFYQIISDFL